jgi:flavin-dependent dehydrogenase
MIRIREAVDNLVVGGGPAGAMLAMRLADAGLNVTLLEKEPATHHKVCGEFLSREAVEYLEQAGLSLRELGAAPIRIIRLSSGRRAVCATLPFHAFSLSRYVLDAVMLERAEEKGCEVKRGVCVDRVEPQDHAWRIQLRDGRTIRAQNVFLANGKHDLHGWNRTDGKQCDLVGFKMHWQLNPVQTKAIRGVMELFLFPGGYGGLSLIETETANLCLVVHRAELQRAGNWSELLAAVLSENPHVLQRMQGAEALWEKPLAVSPIPYGYLVSQPCGTWCVGDQAAVVPSFTGDGLAIALHSGALAAEMFLAGASADDYHRRLVAQLSRGISLATTISRAMVTPIGRGIAPFGLWLFPHAMHWIANSTRIPEEAILRVRGKEKPHLEPTHRKEHIA